MVDYGATLEMPPKKRKAKMGRPKAPEPLLSLAALRGTAAFEVWLDELVEHAQVGTRTQLIKNALKAYADVMGFAKPRPKR